MLSTDPLISIIQRKNLSYPDSDDWFSPSEIYPEYNYSTISKKPNLIYGAVRNCFSQSGLDGDRYGTPRWNPLGELIARGSKVFVLCNFVHHRRVGESNDQFFAKCTHGSVLRALIDYLIIAVGQEGTIRFGCAPIQSCSWKRVLEDTGAKRLVEFYQKHKLPVEASDLRMFVAERDLLGRITHLEERYSKDDVVFIDLGEDSLLSEIHVPGKVHFRVSEYDPIRTESFHGRGQHVYALHRHVLESDVIVSVPKLKTHKKVGLTCALKGCVGAIALKDCLAHHRLGPPDKGGDEYPRDRFGILELQSRFHDYVWHTPPKSHYGNILRVIDRTLRRSQYWLDQIIAGSWWGNDTAWRMALDIARIIAYATVQGRLGDRAIHPHYAIVDGVVGGEGNGPLRPEPVESGVLLFSTDLPWADYICACIMGFDPERINIVKGAFAVDKFPLSNGSPEARSIWLNGNRVELKLIIENCDYHYKAPAGWLHHIERSKV
jgi:hypothetical protein